jgi:hypothetical protein
MPASLKDSAELARQQIQAAREYTLTLLEGLDDEQWTRQVAGYPSHIAWQVGHIAMAQYGLTVLRMRGKEPEDQQVISNDFFKAFKKGSQPAAPGENQPTVAEIRQVFTDVHALAMKLIPTYSEELLAEPLPAPYMVFPNKLGSLLMCPAHEMLHAGQIGLLRRALGKEPVR